VKRLKNKCTRQEEEFLRNLKVSELPKLKYAPFKNVDIDECFSLGKFVQGKKITSTNQKIRVPVMYGAANCEGKV